MDVTATSDRVITNPWSSVKPGNGFFYLDNKLNPMPEDVVG